MILLRPAFWIMAVAAWVSLPIWLAGLADTRMALHLTYLITAN